MQFIDMHCDSLMQLLTLNQKEADLKDSAVTSVDFTRMKAGGQLEIGRASCRERV